MYTRERNDNNVGNDELNHRAYPSSGVAPPANALPDMRAIMPIDLKLHYHQLHSLEAAPNWLVDVELPSQRARAVRSIQAQPLQKPILDGTAETFLSQQHLSQEERIAEMRAHCDAVAMANTTHSLLFTHPSQRPPTMGAATSLGYPQADGVTNAGSELDEMRNLAQIPWQLVDSRGGDSASRGSSVHPTSVQNSAPLLTPGLSRLISSHDLFRQQGFGYSPVEHAYASAMWRQQLYANTSSVPKASVASTEGTALPEIPEGMPRSSLLPVNGQQPDLLRKKQFPHVLYLGEVDDEALTPYQCYLRKHLELFEADEEDVRTSTRQGRTAPVKLGQIGLRCRHCADANVAARTKGAAYYSQTIEGLYQIAQNMSKAHLTERCKYMPAEDRQRLKALRNDSRRANGGKEYWTSRIRELGVYEDPPVLRAKGHPLSTR